MPDKKIKVLLVEDEPMIMEMYKLRLEEEGYEVIVTEKGSEAIKIATEQQPSIILLDVILPEVDGFSVLQTLKGQGETKEIPVFMLTNLSQESDQEKGQQYGASGYFIKAKFLPNDIVNEIKKFLK